MSNLVTVTLDLTEHGYMFNVRVKSRMKSHLFAKVSVNPSECGNADDVLARVTHVAVSGAKHLEITHGDSFNMTELIQHTRESFVESMRKAAETPKTTSDLITKLLHDTSLLDNNQQELVSRAKFLTDRSMPLPSKLSEALQTIWNVVYGAKTAPFAANRA